MKLSPKFKRASKRLILWLQDVALPWLQKDLLQALHRSASILGAFCKKRILPLFQLKAVRSLRLKMQIWQFALLAATIITLLSGFFFYEKQLRYIALDKELPAPIPTISEQLKPGRITRGGGNSQHRQAMSSDGYQLPNASDFDPALEIEQPLVSSHHYAAIWNRRKELIYKTSNAPDYASDDDQIDSSQERLFRWKNRNREVLHFTPNQGWILIGIPRSVVTEELATLRSKLFLIGSGFALVAFVGGWFISGQAIKPIQTISRTAQSIADGNLQNRIKASDTEDELGQLALVLNNTFNRLEAALNRQIQFTADASHELRTPLSIVLNECYWALKTPRDPNDYAASFETCAQTAKHMSGLIESLLQLARIDSGQASLQIQEEQIDALISETIALLKPLAKQKKISLSIDAAPVVSAIDKDKIRQVLINLVSNALQHSPQESKISIRLKTSQNAFLIEVADQGPGITSQDIPYIFDRFYRSDKARSHDGGSGLGLAISKAIAIAHQGDLTVSSNVGVGSIFRLYIPIKLQP